MSRLARVALCLSVLIAACSSVESDWQTASTAGTVSAFQDFLKLHPNGTHADEARARIKSLRDDQAWALAQRTPSVEGYQKYLHDESSGAHAQQARDALAGLAQAAAWQSAQRSNTVAAYADFIQRYPQAPQVAAARTALANLSRQYRVELGAYRIKANATREAKRLNSRFAPLLHQVLAVPSASGGFTRVLSEPMTETEARAACTALQRHHQHCTVVKS